MFKRCHLVGQEVGHLVGQEIGQEIGLWRLQNLVNYAVVTVRFRHNGDMADAI
ncbi:MAG: hypothetical protein AAFS04_02565 [Cyanobacteria bacterium J06631_9]